MPFALMILVSLAAAKDYFMCNDDRHACVVGTTCCGFSPYSSSLGATFEASYTASYGCCAMEVAVCCNDEGGHCCPQGYPICDNNHHVCKDHLTNSVPKQPRIEARKLAMSPDYYSKLLAGIFVGIEAEVGTDDLTACVQETFDAAESLLQLLRYATETHYNDFNQYIVIEELSEFLHTYTSGKVNCLKVVNESTNLLNKFLRRLDNPAQLVADVADKLWSRGNYIYSEVKLSQSVGPYEAGIQFGAAFALLIQ